MTSRSIGLIVLLVLLLFTQAVFAQDNVTVPDVTGLNLPQAVAVLNSNGLRLGKENNTGWTAGSGLPENTVSAQSIPAGQTAAYGTAVDITLLRSANALAIYDDNDFTLVNQTGESLDLNAISFNSISGAAAFPANTWGNSVDNGDCVQIWSIGVRDGKRHPECQSTNWRTTNDPNKHFWTGANGDQEFVIVQGGTVRATCPVANPGQCAFYLPSRGITDAITPFIYFAYTTDRLIVRNTSADQWMLTGEIGVYNQNHPNPDTRLTLGDPGLFTNPDILGDVKRLGPGQCLFFTNGSPESDSPPQDCDVVARLDIAPDLIFWSKDFGLDSVMDDQRRTCPAAEAGKLTLCVMPR